MITPVQFHAMQQRLAPKIRQPVPQDAVDDESGLHSEIADWIRQQHPLPAYIHGRMDRRSTINKGAPDFVILWRGRVILIECKTRTKKRTTDQLAWALLAKLNGYEVHEVRSFGEFSAIVNIYD